MVKTIKIDLTDILIYTDEKHEKTIPLADLLTSKTRARFKVKGKHLMIEIIE